MKLKEKENEKMAEIQKEQKIQESIKSKQNEEIEFEYDEYIKHLKENCKNFKEVYYHCPFHCGL